MLEMNEIEEIKKYITNFVNESNQLKNKISEIEKERIQLAYDRNLKKTVNNQDNNVIEINALGREISVLGNKSQEIQNKLDCKFNETKKTVNLTIDNLVTDRMRGICRLNEEKQELIQNQTNLSQKTKIKEIEKNINNIEIELVELATIKRNFKNRNLSDIIYRPTEEIKVLPLLEEFQIEELENIEFVQVEQIEFTERTEIGEIEIEQDNEIKEQKPVVQQTETDKIEILARAIVEEIIFEQTKDLNIKGKEQEIITSSYENKKIENKTQNQLKIILNITANIQDGEFVYKAQINNGDEIKVYPTLEARNILLNDKEYREEISEILTSYAEEENKELDNAVIKKIDPTICEILERFAKQHKYNYKKLIYEYSMSFSKKITNNVVPPISYNLSYLKNTNLSRKEKTIISKLYKNALKNKNINVIEDTIGFRKIKYLFRKIFKFNDVKELQEGKY